MKRPARLQAARVWLEKYSGKNVVAGYRKHFGTDWPCAFLELELLGVHIDAAYKDSVLKSIQNEAEARRRKKAQQEMEMEAKIRVLGQDEHFAFIVGHTAGGFPYGMRWEELEEWGEEDDKEEPIAIDEVRP